MNSSTTVCTAYSIFTEPLHACDTPSISRSSSMHVCVQTRTTQTHTDKEAMTTMHIPTTNCCQNEYCILAFQITTNNTRLSKEDSCYIYCLRHTHCTQRWSNSLDNCLSNYISFFFFLWEESKIMIMVITLDVNSKGIYCGLENACIPQTRCG